MIIIHVPGSHSLARHNYNENGMMVNGNLEALCEIFCRKVGRLVCDRWPIADFTSMELQLSAKIMLSKINLLIYGKQLQNSPFLLKKIVQYLVPPIQAIKPRFCVTLTIACLGMPGRSVNSSSKSSVMALWSVSTTKCKIYFSVRRLFLLCFSFECT